MIVAAGLHPNEIAKQLTGRAYTSWSAITTYTSCPLRYFFRYLENVPEKCVSASLVFGGAIHAAVECHLRERLAGNSVPSLDALMAAFNDNWQEHEGQQVQFGKGESRDTLDDLARRMLTAFQASELATPPGTIIGIEEELTGELVPSVPDLLARVDLLVDDGDALILTDLKTARSRWSDNQVQDSAGQLLLYHELAKPIADGRPIRLEFAVVTKTKAPEVIRHEVRANPQQIDRVKKIVEQVWAAIKASIFYPSPSPMQCPTCAYRQACRNWSG